MTREEAISKAINIVSYFEAHFAKSKEAREDAVNIIEALEQEPCDDAISRQAVLNLAKFDGRDGLGSIIHAFDVEQLPPVKPAEKVGKWVTTITPLGKCCTCSKCGSCPPIEYRYCPYCGAKMQEGEE